MAMSDDEKAFMLLEKAVNKAQASLEKTKHFQPFLMLLNDAGETEVFENEGKETSESYAILEKTAEESIAMDDVDIMLLVADTAMPENLSQDVPHGIRLHIEEKSQVEKKVSARFIYVPYELCQIKDEAMYVKLHTPIAVGFPAEYIVK